MGFLSYLFGILSLAITVDGLFLNEGIADALPAKAMDRG